MRHWKEQNKDLGTIKAKTTQTIVFTTTEDLPKNLGLSSSCGCSRPKKISNREIEVVYKPSSIPTHLKQQGYYVTRKSIFVKDRDTDESDTLTFKAVIEE